MEITREKYVIQLDEKGAICSLISHGKQFINKRLPLLAIQLRNGEMVENINSDNAKKVDIKSYAEKIEIKYAFENLNFDVTLFLSDRIEATFSFENKTTLYVEWVEFCAIAVPNDLVSTGGSGRVAIDTNEGMLIEDIKLKENFYPYKYRPMNYPSEGLYAMFPAVVQSQFLTYYDDVAGIYMAAEDALRAIKGIDFGPLEDSIKLQFRLYPGIEKDIVNFDLSYNLVIDFFSGDWYDAAALYRNWFEKNLPENLVAVKDNKDLPEWYTDSPLVVTYPVQGIHDMDEAKPNRLFPYNNALPYLDEIAKATNSRIMTALMHWESTAPWAPPYVWPPLGGEEMLKDFCKELHKRDYILGVYCSGISYTIHSNINDYNMQSEYDQKGLSRHMCASPTGEIISKTCQAQRKSYDMCIAEDFTKNVLLNEAEKMASCGLDYIQILDQNHGGTPYFCFSDKHNHPAVPGKWMVEHMTDFLKKLKNIVGKNVLLGCESAAAESYIPYMNLSDNRFNLNGYVGKFIPLYGYIYHKYLQNFSGNSVCSQDIFDEIRSPESYLLRAAHSFLAGDLMTLVINQDGEIAWAWGEREFDYLPDRKSVLDFIKSANTYKRGVGKDYLTFGQMIKPHTVTSENVKMYKTNAERFTEYPAVLTTAWESSDGGRAQFLANYCNENKMCTIDLSCTNGADLIDQDGNVVKSIPAENCVIEVPRNSVMMLALK